MVFPKRPKASPQTHEQRLEIERKQAIADLAELNKDLEYDPEPLAALQASLDAGMDPSAPNTQGLAPIHYAALHGYAECIPVLAQRGAEINARNAHQETALHLSAGYGDLKTLAQLILAGADVNLENEDGQTPLLLALSQGNLQAVELLLHAGALIEPMALEQRLDPQQEECVNRINEYFGETRMITVGPTLLPGEEA